MIMQFTWILPVFLLLNGSFGQETPDVALFATSLDVTDAETVFNISCMASRKLRFAALGLNIPNKPEITVRQRRARNDNQDTFKCDFTKDDCNNENPASWVQSETYGTVLYDERWEDLPISTTENDDWHIIQVRDDTFVFSILGDEHVEIQFGGMNNYYRISIDKDYAQIDMILNNNKNILSFVNDENILLPNKWKTYMLTHTSLGTGQHKIELSDMGNYVIILSKTFNLDSLPPYISITHIKYKSMALMQWKLHHITALQNLKPKGVFVRRFEEGRSISCIAIHCKLCSVCALYVEFNANGQTLFTAQILKSGKGWQRNIAYYTQPGITELKIRTDGPEDEKFFVLLDDMEECGNQELKVISAEISIAKGSEQLLHDINCEVIGNPGLTTAISEPTVPDSRNCEIGKVGPECTFDCSEILVNKLCENTVICGQNKCQCAPNYMGPLCNVPPETYVTPRAPETTIEPRIPMIGCTLPPLPEHGSYEIHGNEQSGEPIQLEYSCEKSFQLETREPLICQGTEWDRPPPKCIRYCPPLIDSTLEIICMTNDEEVDCNKPMLDGTVASVECKPSYELRTLVNKPYTETVCFKGTWDHELYKCDPVCGVVLTKYIPLIVKGFKSYAGEFPWHVGLYISSSGSTEDRLQICGGTLISLDIVVTAAHCVWNDDTFMAYPNEMFSVAAGKRYRNWFHEDDAYCQYNTVEEVIVARRFRARESLYANDIALLKLKKAFFTSTVVHPVCIDWSDIMYNEELQTGTLGMVAGWGLLKEHGNPAVTLHAASLPYTSYETCKNNVSASFKPLITYDKFCGGSGNGTNVCQGDSGGGFVFLKGGRYYLQGVVSVGANKDDTCDTQVYAAFTAIHHHLKWIENMQRKLQEDDIEIIQCKYPDGRGCVDTNSQTK